MSSEQVEYVCPQCRRRTVVNAKPGEEETVFCPRCEIDMKPYVKTSEVAAAAANAPSSSGGVAAATKTKATKTTKPRKTAAKVEGAPVKATKAKSTRATAKAAAAPPPVQPDFGDFRCLCCGLTKTVPLGTEKPAGGWRCPTCFVKLAWLKS
ncbi:hypothetical protein IV102_08735 [bacterium]|nr:hypothetical protein [bacterium]